MIKECALRSPSALAQQHGANEKNDSGMLGIGRNTLRTWIEYDREFRSTLTPGYSSTRSGGIEYWIGSTHSKESPT